MFGICTFVSSPLAGLVLSMIYGGHTLCVFGEQRVYYPEPRRSRLTDDDVVRLEEAGEVRPNPCVGDACGVLVLHGRFEGDGAGTQLGDFE